MINNLLVYLVIWFTCALQRFILVVLLILQPLRNVGQQSKQRPTLKTVGFLCCLSNLACLNFSKWQESSFMADFCKQVFHKPAVLNKPQDFLLKKVKIVQNGSIKRVQGCFFGSFHASWRSWQNTHWTTLGRANNYIPNVLMVTLGYLHMYHTSVSRDGQSYL